MQHKTISELSRDLAKRKISAVELAQYFLARIKLLNPKLNSFITITEEQALSQAKLADQKIARGEATLLTGIPIAHKDTFCTTGIKTTCGSKALANFISPYNATVVERLNAAGTVLLGKTNMDEFSMGSSNETSYFGPAKNPWNLLNVPGGSSGGSAAAVAARLVLAATGTDSGGSVRQPAGLCGVTGLKPTYGRVSRYGMVAFASSLDQAGIMAKTAEDVALILQAIAGLDPKDSTSADFQVPDYCKNLEQPIQGLKIGLPKEYFTAGINSGVAIAFDTALSELEKLGAKIVHINLPHTKLAIPTYHVIAPAECSSNLARFDGVRFGYRCPNPKNIEDLYIRSRSASFGDEVKRRILIGTYVLSAGYYDNFYLQAQKIRQLISADFKEAFKQVDVIITPTTPAPAFKIGEKTRDPVSMYLSDIFVVPINLAGLPAISLPCGFAEDLPVGLHIIGNYFTEEKLCNVAHCLQKNTAWHLEKPTITT
ncbi:MAG: Asp-tRNA(Asn)/Glu-tRNA(Gln) amidotransferase subunit GatA [Gammaproteobacteria bacterium]|nr:Asp-tRNA(Asn)/Glu-tRNA(Gln) amidotransferase subunit GatA [Gammaproteobacteria bacterium]